MKLSMVLPFSRAMDAGSGGGGAGSGGQGGQHDSGAARQPSGSGGTPYELKDDSQVLWDGKPATWKDIRSQHFVPRTEYDGLRKTHEDARTLLTDHARRLDMGFAELERQKKALKQSGQPPMSAQQQIDIVEELSGMPLIDGPTMAKLVKDLRANGLTPLANLVTQLANQVKQQGTQIEQMRSTTGVLSEQHQSQQFDTKITSLLKDLPEVKGLSKVPIDNPVIRELAVDLWSAYDPKTWNDGDFRKMFAERLSGLVSLVIADQKAQVEAAKEKQRTFFDPKKGSAHPSGQGGKYRHMTGAQIAKESGLFNRNNAA